MNQNSDRIITNLDYKTSYMLSFLENVHFDRKRALFEIKNMTKEEDNISS